MTKREEMALHILAGLLADCDRGSIMLLPKMATMLADKLINTLEDSRPVRETGVEL